MNVAKKIPVLTLEDFILQYEGTRFQYIDGEAVESQAVKPDHSFAQSAFAGTLWPLFSSKGGPNRPGGWWILTEAAVRYGKTLFSHDLAGWSRQRLPQRPRSFPI